jgi:hypothetical protein
MAWLHQAARIDGATYAQVLLMILKRLELLEAALQRSTCKEFLQVPPTPEAAPVATDEKPFPPHIDITYQPKSVYQPLAPQPTPPVEPVTVDARDPGCVERWPDCHSEGYDSRCCRFPKSCSCGGEPPVAQPTSPAAPAWGLVERVAHVIGDDPLLLSLWEDDARAAIREVAAWMRENETGYNAARWLELEADRG